jgi:hypothetical protein
MITGNGNKAIDDSAILFLEVRCVNPQKCPYFRSEGELDVCDKVSSSHICYDRQLHSELIDKLKKENGIP